MCHTIGCSRTSMYIFDWSISICEANDRICKRTIRMCYGVFRCLKNSQGVLSMKGHQSSKNYLSFPIPFYATLRHREPLVARCSKSNNLNSSSCQSCSSWAGLLDASRFMRFISWSLIILGDPSRACGSIGFVLSIRTAKYVPHRKHRAVAPTPRAQWWQPIFGEAVDITTHRVGQIA
jgi:hypothetical protein